MRYSPKIHLVLFWCNLLAIYCEGALEWSYTGSQGPSTWSRSFSKCGGLQQSPVDIQTKETVFEGSKPLELKYDSSVPVKMENNGLTVQCLIKSNKKLDISGGGLPRGSVFRATKIHLHWGSNNSVGSEHKFNGKSFPLEMHVLHYNTKYNGFDAAANKSDGIASVAVLFEQSNEDNPQLSAITQLLSNVSYEGKLVDIDSLSVTSLLPSDSAKFYRYHGSFTTPGCKENVEWIIFKTPATISGRQLELFRQLYRVNSTVTIQNTKPQLLVNNFRPVQLLNQRIIRRNFDPPPMFCGRKGNTSATCSKLLRGRDVRFEVKVSPCSVLPVGVFVGVTVPDEDFNWTHTFVTSLDDAVRIASLNYSVSVEMHTHWTGDLHVTVSQLDMLSEKAELSNVISEKFPVDQICSVLCTSTEFMGCSRMIRSGNDTLEIGFAAALENCDNGKCKVWVKLYRNEGPLWAWTGIQSFVDGEAKQFDLTSHIVHSDKRKKRHLVHRRSTQPHTTFKAEIKNKKDQVDFKLYLVVSNGISYEVVSKLFHPFKDKRQAGGGSSTKVVIGVVVVLILVALIGGVAFLLYHKRHYFRGHQPALVDEMAYDDNITDNRL